MWMLPCRLLSIPAKVGNKGLMNGAVDSGERGEADPPGLRPVVKQHRCTRGHREREMDALRRSR
jgi:hypothetical protein